MVRVLGETNSWKKPEVENLMTLFLSERDNIIKTVCRYGRGTREFKIRFGTLIKLLHSTIVPFITEIKKAFW